MQLPDIGKEIPDQMNEIGYDTYNPISNLGTVSAFIMFYVLKVVVYYFFRAL